MKDQPPAAVVIHVNSRLRKFKIREEKLIELTQRILSLLRLRGVELTISFVSSKTMRSLNAVYRQKNYDTDVLSFPQIEMKEPLTLKGSPQKINGLLGDLVISPMKAHENARELGHSLSREVAFLLLHGILHLVGHDHQNHEDESLMLEIQRRVMKKLWPSSMARMNFIQEVSRG